MIDGSSVEEKLGEEDSLAAGQPRGRLVEHQHAGLGCERHRDRHLAMLAVREVADALAELVVDRDAACGLPRPLSHLPVASR